MYPKPKKLPFDFTYSSDNYLDLNQNYSKEVYKTYILCLENHQYSMEAAKLASDSLKDLDMPYELFYGFNGTDGKTIVTPEHLKNKEYLRWIKIVDTGLTVQEVSCALGHIALWAHCLTINKPIVILEHDAIMLKKFTELKHSNSIEYLGHYDDYSELYTRLPDELKQNLKEKDISSWYKNNNHQVIQTECISPVQVINYNFCFTRGLQAYAIDPLAANILLSTMLAEGLLYPIDVFLHSNRFNVVKHGLYATLNNNAKIKSTISTPNANGRKPAFLIPGVTSK